MSTYLKKEWLSVLALLGTIVLSFYYFDLLPEKVPTHFNLHGEADGWGSKNTLIIPFPIIKLTTYLLLFFLNKIDPKKKIDSPYSKPLPQVRALTSLLLFGIYWVILSSAKTGSLEPKWMIGVLVGIIFVGLGNFMNTVKPNYFLGFRTPWTLENAEVWKATHRLVSKIWVSGGLVFLVALPFLSEEMMIVALLTLTFVGVLWPFIYSYQLFKKLT